MRSLDNKQMVWQSANFPALYFETQQQAAVAAMIGMEATGQHVPTTRAEVEPGSVRFSSVVNIEGKWIINPALQTELGF